MKFIYSTRTIALLLAMILNTTIMNAQQKINGTVAAITEITPKAGFEKEILAAGKYIQQEASKESGCLLFSLNTKKDAPAVVVLFEVFKDEKALDNHKQQAHTQQFLKMLEGRFTDNKVIFLNALGANYH